MPQQEGFGKHCRINLLTHLGTPADLSCLKSEFAQSMIIDNANIPAESQAEKTAEQEKTGRETVTRLATRLHHLRSTATRQGIYNSPYHVGYHPTAFGVPVEELGFRPLVTSVNTGPAGLVVGA